jgi:hypothetical protein
MQIVSRALQARGKKGKEAPFELESVEYPPDPSVWSASDRRPAKPRADMNTRTRARWPPLQRPPSRPRRRRRSARPPRARRKPACRRSPSSSARWRAGTACVSRWAVPAASRTCTWGHAGMVCRLRASMDPWYNGPPGWLERKLLLQQLRDRAVKAPTNKVRRAPVARPRCTIWTVPVRARALRSNLCRCTICHKRPGKRPIDRPSAATPAAAHARARSPWLGPRASLCSSSARPATAWTCGTFL